MHTKHQLPGAALISLQRCAYLSSLFTPVASFLYLHPPFPGKSSYQTSQSNMATDSDQIIAVFCFV